MISKCIAVFPNMILICSLQLFFSITPHLLHPTVPRGQEGEGGVCVCECVCVCVCVCVYVCVINLKVDKTSFNKMQTIQ